MPRPVLPGLSTWQGEDQRNPGVHVPFVHLGVGEAWCGGLVEELPLPFLGEPRGWDGEGRWDIVTGRPSLLKELRWGCGRLARGT